MTFATNKRTSYKKPQWSKVFCHATVALLASLLLLAGAWGADPALAQGDQQYTVTFKDHNGTVLGTRQVPFNGMPDATGIVTERTGHVFTGWIPSITNVTADMETTAQYRMFDITVRFFTKLLEDGSETYLTRGKATLNQEGNFAAQLPAGYAWTFNGNPFSGLIPFLSATDGNVLDVYANVCNLTLIDSVSGGRRTVTLPVGSSFVLEPLPHDGFVFTGWEPADAVVGGMVTVSSSIELTAQYRTDDLGQEIHQIYYYEKPLGQGGDVIYRQQVIHGGDVTEFPHPAYNPTLAGHTFQGWDATLPIENVTERKHIYPLFAPNLRAAFYDWQDDTQPLYTTFVERGTFATYGGPTPERAGFVFTGWFPDPAQTPVMADINFVAQYRARSDRLYLLTVLYRFPNGTVAAQPHVANLPLSEIPYAVTSPAIMGFVPDQQVVTVTTDDNTPKEIVVTVTYNPSTGTPYIVRHYQQKLGVSLAGGIDTNITKYDLALSETFHSTTGSIVDVIPKSFPGFALIPDQDDEVRIAADGSTVVNVFYSRNTYAVYFISAGGTYIPPVVAEFDAPISGPGTPTRPGFIFEGWDKPMPAKMPVDGDRLEAIWKNGPDVAYTLSYWLENAEGTGYDFHKTVARTGPAGSPALVNNNPADRPVIQHFAYERHEAKTIAGDGSTIVNVFYTRAMYRIVFTWENIGTQPPVGAQIFVNGELKATYPETYEITARYMEDISLRWPSGTDVKSPTGSLSNYVFHGWRDPSRSTIHVSKRLNMTDDLFNVAGTRYVYANWTNTPVLKNLHYMFECIDPNDPDGVLHINGTTGNTRYKKSALYSQIVTTSTGRFLCKEIEGFTAVAEDAIERAAAASSPWDFDVYLYYYRNTYQLEFFNFNSRDGLHTLMYEAPLASYMYTPQRPAVLDDDFEFGGWYTTYNCLPGTEFTGWGNRNMPAYNLTLYAHWVPPTYGVTFYSHNESGDEVQFGPVQSLLKGSLVEKPATDPERPGYRFLGWFDRDTDLLFQFDVQRVMDDTELVAKWTARDDFPYEVHYWLVGSDWQMGDPADTRMPPGLITPNPLIVPNNQIGSTVYEEAPIATAYVPDAISKSRLIGTSENRIDFYFKAFVTLEYTVMYVDGEGNELFPPKTVTTDRSVVVEDAVNIPGYSPNPVQQTRRLAWDSANNIITFEYMENRRASYTIEYYNMNSDGLYPPLGSPQHSETLSGYVGERVTAPERPMVGFILDFGNSYLEGFIEDGDTLVLRVFYRRVMQQWTVHYYHTGTTIPAVQSESGTMQVGQTKTATELDMPGYVFHSANPSSKSVVISADPLVNVIIFYYTRITDEPTKHMLDKPDGVPVYVGETLVYEITYDAPEGTEIITITDELPEGLAYVDSTPSASVTGQTVVWTLDTGEHELTGSVWLTVKAVSKPASGTLKNTATIQYDDGAPYEVEDEERPVEELDEPTKSIPGKAGGVALYVGETVVYQITYDAPEGTETIKITDVLPADLAYISSTPNASVSGQTVTWNLATATHGLKGSVTLTVKVTSLPTSGTLKNTATVQYDEGDPYDIEDDERPVEDLDRPTKTIPAKASDVPIYVGETFEYRITYDAPTGTQTVKITDVLPAGLRHVGSTPDADVSGQTVTWTLNTATHGLKGHVTLLVTLDTKPASGTLKNTATVQYDNGIPHDVEDGERLVEELDKPTKSIPGKADGVALYVGETVVYQITYDAPIGTETIKVTDVLPAELAYISSTPNASVSGQTVTWNLAAATHGLKGSVTLTVKVEGVPASGMLRNIATVQYDEGAPYDLEDDERPVEEVDEPTKTIPGKAAGASIYVGETFEYRITYDAPTGTQAVKITDVLPAGLRHVSSTPNASVSGQTVTWTLNTATHGLKGHVTLRVTLDTKPASGVIKNTATVQYDNSAPHDAEDEERPVEELDEPAKTIPGKAAGAPIYVGETVEYRITYDAPTGTQTVKITDVLPAGLQYVSSTPSASVSGQTVTWTLNTATYGLKGHVTLRVMVDTKPASGIIKNTATVQYDNSAPHDAEDEERPVEELTEPTKSIPGKAAGAALYVGETVVYQITYDAPAGTETIKITDVLPTELMYVSSTPNASVSGKTVTWTLATATHGLKGSVTLTVRVASKPASGTLKNIATVAYDDGDPYDAEDEERPVQELDAPTKTIPGKASGTPLYVGETFEYRITYDAPTGTQTVKITDVLPAGLQYVSSTPSASVSGQTVTWTLNTATHGLEGHVTLRVMVDTKPAGGIIKNTATVQYDNSVPHDAEDERRPVEELDAPTKSIPGKATGAAVHVGETFEYLITYHAPMGTSTVTITDVLPAGVKYISSTPNASVNGQTVTWMLDTATSGLKGNVRVMV
ncbi:MAG: isopeptide-forming domain-containing fimbrial protein, partial [Clostridia bacterium]|nr:isopeptide-forming domain-containing fimbrial protein [Clostridia bacterium]